MKQTARYSGRQERGNALFLILIAVALFAALSYAITSSGRGSGNITNEQALINAGQLTQYPAMVRAAATRMILTGTQASLLNLEQVPSGTLSNAVFSTQGGSVIWQSAPANVAATTVWHWKAAPATNTGWYISGLGTDTATGKDVFGFLDDVTTSVCQQILKGVGLNVTPRIEAVAVDTTTGTNEGDALLQTGGGTAVQTAGANAWSFDIWNTIDAPDFPTVSPQPFACVDNAGGGLLYYHAVVEL